MELIWWRPFNGFVFYIVGLLGPALRLYSGMNYLDATGYGWGVASYYRFYLCIGMCSVGGDCLARMQGSSGVAILYGGVRIKVLVEYIIVLELEATSVTSTMLRLIYPFGESAGRFVHQSE